MAGVDQGAELFTATTGLLESQDETLRQAVQFDAAGFPTGLYPYRLMVYFWKYNYVFNSNLQQMVLSCFVYIVRTRGIRILDLAMSKLRAVNLS